MGGKQNATGAKGLCVLSGAAANKNKRAGAAGVTSAMREYLLCLFVSLSCRLL